MASVNPRPHGVALALAGLAESARGYVRVRRDLAQDLVVSIVRGMAFNEHQLGLRADLGQFLKDPLDIAGFVAGGHDHADAVILGLFHSPVWDGLP